MAFLKLNPRHIWKLTLTLISRTECNKKITKIALLLLPTKFPEGAKATLMTHADLSGITCTLLPLQVSQIINFPSSEPVTQCLWTTFHSVTLFAAVANTLMGNSIILLNNFILLNLLKVDFVLWTSQRSRQPPLPLY